MPETPHTTARLFETQGIANPLDVLKRVYGFSAFRGQQQGVVEHVVAGGDAVVLFPTGAGKSLCFQIPALCRKGVGIVISPLIALMRDQVEALKQLDIRAAALNSSLTRDEAIAVRRALSADELDLLYVTPERAVTDGFAEMIGDMDIALFAIDEAHCFPVFTVSGTKQKVSITH
ncbi:superfamily II DNA helicase RecQ [Sinorhizobium fredii]